MNRIGRNLISKCLEKTGSRYKNIHDWNYISPYGLKLCRVALTFRPESNADPPNINIYYI